MKKLIALLLCVLSCAALFSAGVSEDSAALIADIPTAQYFTDEAVAAADVETILLAGINAPSGMNQQPWHFTAVTDQSVLDQIAEDMRSGMPAGVMPPASSTAITKAGIADAPLAIIVSCTEGNDLNAGLATQNMSVVANLLGYGTKIISSPTIALNGEKLDEYRALLGIPQDQKAVAVVLVGKVDTSIDESVDGYTGATPRNPFDTMVTFVGN